MNRVRCCNEKERLFGEYEEATSKVVAAARKLGKDAQPDFERSLAEARAARLAAEEAWQKYEEHRVLHGC
jgi:delta 1-pyrroline-5-carboxylate dehydrogenase